MTSNLEEHEKADAVDFIISTLPDELRFCRKISVEDFPKSFDYRSRGIIEYAYMKNDNPPLSKDYATQEVSAVEAAVTVQRIETLRMENKWRQHYRFVVIPLLLNSGLEVKILIGRD